MIDNNGHFDILTNDSPELITARKLGEHLEFLREQVRQTEEAWLAAWKKVPADPNITKKPHQSDFPSRCRNCGRPTKWVHPKGYSAHFIKRDDQLVMECPPNKLGKTTEGIPDEVWALLDMPDDEFMNLSDEETLEIIQGRSLGSDKNVEKKPSEREN